MSVSVTVNKRVAAYKATALLIARASEQYELIVDCHVSAEAHNCSVLAGRLKVKTRRCHAQRLMAMTMRVHGLQLLVVMAAATYTRATPAASDTYTAHAAAPAASESDGRILAWHITDPHVDPFYTEGAPTEACYCRSHELCPARPSSASCTPSPSGASGPFGNAEADCETPELLFASSLQHAAAVAPAADLVLFTGDFCAYMLETPCVASASGLEPGASRTGLLACIASAYAAVKTEFQNALVLPSLGNHDTVVMEYDARLGACRFKP